MQLSSSHAHIAYFFFLSRNKENTVFASLELCESWRWVSSMPAFLGKSNVMWFTMWLKVNQTLQPPFCAAPVLVLLWDRRVASHSSYALSSLPQFSTHSQTYRPCPLFHCPQFPISCGFLEMSLSFIFPLKKTLVLLLESPCSSQKMAVAARSVADLPWNILESAGSAKEGDDFSLFSPSAFIEMCYFQELQSM